MLTPPRPAVPVVVAVALLLAAASFASAHTVTGGASAPSRPEIEDLECGTGEGERCPSGELLRVEGEYLESTRTVTFLGGRGRADDRRARPRAKSAHRVLVRVPARAQSGPVQVRSRWAGASRKGPTLAVETAPAAAPAPVAAPGPAQDGVFPVRGAHDFGTAVNGFGGGRDHRGQDILAACGTPVVAARSGRVEWVRWQSAAGNYAVITGADGSSQAYLHLLTTATVKQGQQVRSGQQIGQVGRTGRATACHLHFELWTSPGWYRGGQAVDPLPDLRRWDRGGG
jgi:murein DD-endopeptidase MepM/ murein hydrolase activator NlpD